MNKKAYQKPSIRVQELALENEILAASDGINATISDDDVIESGSIDARPHYGIWDEDKD